MRTLPLATESPLVRATSAEQMRVGLAPGLRQLAEERFTGGMIARQFEMGAATSAAISDEERETFREAERGRRSRLAQLERDLVYETDQVRIGQLNSELDALLGEAEAQRDEIFRSAVDDGRLLEPEAVQERYGIEADRLMSPREAELIVQGRREQEIRNAIVDAGPRGLVPGALRFGTSVLTAATDPVELASMFIPVVGPARSAAMVARFGRVGGRAAIGATEGAVGSLLTEPLYYGLSQAQQLDYSMEDALFNIGAGLFLGGGIGTVAGIFSRRDLNYGDIAEATRFDNQVISGDAVELPAPPAAARAEGVDAVTSEAAARQRFREETYGFMGGRQSFELAVRMMANDASVNVELTMPRTVPRPQTLSEFVRERGGINSTDPAVRAQLDELRASGIDPEEITRIAQEGGVVAPVGSNSLQEMATLAQQRGFIDAADGVALVGALRQEAGGSFVFRRQDQRKAGQWRKYHQAENDIQAELLRREDIRSELDAIGYRDATEDEIGLLSSEMARGRTLDEAAKTIGIQAEGLRAAELARYMESPEADRLADPEASARVDEVPDEFDFNAAIVREEEILRQMEVDGTLTAEQRTLLQAARAIDAQADAYIEAVQAAAICVMRT
jgi:hypothetical protein